MYGKARDNKFRLFIRLSIPLDSRSIPLNFIKFDTFDQMEEEEKLDGISAIVFEIGPVSARRL